MAVEAAGGGAAGGLSRARRQYVEKKFARDTERARLEWLKAKAFTAASGGVDASEEFGRKGQQLREMTRDLDLLRADVDLIAMIVRLRGATVPGDEAGDGDEAERGA